MTYYSQNQEDKHIASYFKGAIGRLLDLGANDGKTFSNSLHFIENGWEAVLVEPSKTCLEKIEALHGKNKKVQVIPVAVGTETGTFIMHESGSHLGQGDTSLVSTLVESEKKRWANEEFTEVEVQCYSYDDLMKKVGSTHFDYISIDIEGMDYHVLSQIDLTNVSCVCVEHNGVNTEAYIKYCKGFGMRILHNNNENVIMVM